LYAFKIEKTHQKLQSCFILVMITSDDSGGGCQRRWRRRRRRRRRKPRTIQSTSGQRRRIQILSYCQKICWSFRMKFHFSIGGALHPATMKKKNWLRRWKGTTSSKWFTRESDGGNFRFVSNCTSIQPMHNKRMHGSTDHTGEQQHHQHDQDF